MTEERSVQDAWLFPDADEAKAKANQLELLIAQKYLVFSGPTSDPRARELFEHWTRMARQEFTVRNASVQEYAATAAFREFIEKIHMKIEFANKGANQPQLRTK